MVKVKKYEHLFAPAILTNYIEIIDILSKWPPSKTIASVTGTGKLFNLYFFKQLFSNGSCHFYGSSWKL